MTDRHTAKRTIAQQTVIGHIRFGSLALLRVQNLWTDGSVSIDEYLLPFRTSAVTDMSQHMDEREMARVGEILSKWRTDEE